MESYMHQTKANLCFFSVITVHSNTRIADWRDDPMVAVVHENLSSNPPNPLKIRAWTPAPVTWELQRRQRPKNCWRLLFFSLVLGLVRNFVSGHESKSNGLSRPTLSSGDSLGRHSFYSWIFSLALIKHLSPNTEFQHMIMEEYTDIPFIVLLWMCVTWSRDCWHSALARVQVLR